MRAIDSMQVVRIQFLSLAEKILRLMKRLKCEFVADQRITMEMRVFMLTLVTSGNISN